MSSNSSIAEPKPQTAATKIRDEEPKHVKMSASLEKLDPSKLEKGVESKVDWSQKMSFWCCSCFSYLLQVIFLGCMGSFLFGINLSLLNTAINHISWEMEWCDFRNEAIEVNDCTRHTVFASFINTGVFIGAAMGSMSGGLFLGFGRRGMMLIANAIFILGIITCCCANSFSALLWARLLVGYSVGLISFIVPTYMSEMTPKDVRGRYGVLHQLFITIGILVGTLIGLPLPLAAPLPGPLDADKAMPVFPKVWWRVMLGIGIIPVLLSSYLLSKVYVFETPHYYVEKGLYNDAEKLLKRVRNSDDVTETLNYVIQEIQESEKSKAAGMNLGTAWRKPELRRVIILGCLFSAFQQFGGINVFMAQSTQLFLDAGLEGSLPTVMTVVMSLINCVMTLPAVPLIEKMGRKSLLLCGCVGMTISVLPSAICYWVIPDSDVTMWLAIVGCLLFIIFFAATYGPILWVYLFEMFPMEIKGAAAGLATAFNWIAGIVMVFVTNYLSIQVKFTLFTAMSALGTVLVASFMLETKGRELGDSPYIKKSA
eukprot:Protomagalhaensia_wolfi_Nauph_80__6152@NODE_8_length_5760_cov_41_165705_g6_i0_p1_GENE_NODE_8_length_5760_cov_41_165705_g6_i0NODE_8_length_5760_cov_41_165705_g6_i0_p1_ORF_typecomplete_len540_score101_83Sugar_tr/PF00083_24/3_2e96MFS_1/PF07690_16/8_6e17MFS_1/PF07690_16/2_2e10MFS_2/PF13347_6/9_7e02MFS_2/PF13347_6/4_4e09MFS_2/PF13347_6/37MFS_3/PF05977_13/3_2e06MFS_3/PF05977_13/0_012TRI12/PF06609_13/3_4e07TRI12/PF06609_13/6_1e02MFS_4/PF06779_14/0_038MFS_1_like/PF12832_7/2_4MFS_1_like/PF12832_7/5_9_NOD